MSVHDSPDETTTSGGVTSPPPLDVDAVRSAREWMTHPAYAGVSIPEQIVEGLLAAYDNLAARHAYLAASTVPVSDGVIQQDAHSDRLLLREIKEMHRDDGEGFCYSCGYQHPCDTLLLIEGKA